MKREWRLPEPAEWLRPQEAAVLLGVTMGNVRTIAHRKRWRSLRVGNESAYRYDDVIAEFDRRRVDVGNGYQIM